MKNITLVLGILLAFACSKTEVPATPPVVVIQEEAIKFTTNLDTGTYNVADTLPLVVTLSSKLPSAGVLYSILVNWTDSSKQIFKLDTNLTVSSLSLNIPGLKKTGSYSLSVTVTSKSTLTNTLNKSIPVVNNPLGRFMGYKVNISLRQKDEINYWRDCGILWDVIGNKYFERPNGSLGSFFMAQAIAGDFNNDGYIDIFNPGTGSYNGKPAEYNQWLIWNPTTKIFDNKKLFNNKALQYFGGNQRRSIAYDINKDGFTDVVIFDHGDDTAPPGDLSYWQPLRIVLSDAKGGYDLKDLTNITPNLMYNHSGDIGDLNNDGFPDLVSATGNTIYISWGISNYPYFSNNVAYFSVDYFNPKFVSDNGFGDNVPQAAGADIITIADVNKDGWNDIIEGGSEMSMKYDTYLPWDLKNRVLINQGKGRFNQNGIIQLPYYLDDLSNVSKRGVNHDYRVLDFNNDGLNDIISSSSVSYDNYYFNLYIQNKDGSFSLDKTKFTFNINASNRTQGTTPGHWKPWLMLYDFNGDGIKDVSYIDNTNFLGELKTKTVFIRTGDQYIEQDFYQFDPYLNSIKPK
jgi:hypothetical protein